jgi:serine/threonine protein kinase
MERGILNCKYARLKKTHLKDNSTKLFGFILMAKGQCLQFYNENQDLINQWIEAFKTTAILLDLKEEFKLGPLLGRGNFAKVHSCTRQNDPGGQTFALKTIEKSQIKKCKRNIMSVLQEIDILRKLHHPYIIKLYEVYESNKYIHLVLSYLDGGELFDRIKSKQVYKEKTAIICMKNMLEALKYMHENDVVHRDLKPENLILAQKDNDSDLRIADFGLASFIKAGEMLKLRCGSPGYVAPELLDDVGYEKKADIFSAGVIFYVLLTGRPVFRGYNINEILLKNKKCEVEYPQKYWDKISDKAKDLVSRMLEKDPNARISAEEALEHPWFTQDEQEIGDEVLDFAAAHEEDKE